MSLFALLSNLSGSNIAMFRTSCSFIIEHWLLLQKARNLFYSSRIDSSNYFGSDSFLGDAFEVIRSSRTLADGTEAVS